MSKAITLLFSLLLWVNLSSCKQKEEGPSVHKFPNSSSLKWQVLEEGLEYAVLSQGNGDSIQEGTKLEVYYTAWYSDLILVDSNKDKRPHRFKVGQGRVIQGWERLIPKVNKGGKIYLKLSHEYAFGDGKADGIRPFSVVYFGIEIEN